ncbi:hypothetical protein BsWGS_27116 [Bradybaena similaris]
MKTSHFILSIFLAIVIAKLNPSIGSTGGLLKPEITVKYITVSLVFLNTGLSLPTEELKVAILRWDLHLYVQGFTFFVFPCIMRGVVFVLQHTFLHPALLDGLMILSTMPPPVSSAIILTKLVGGNVAASVFNSALGSLLGIFITPALILFMFGSSEVEVPAEKIFQQLFMTVLVPLVFGQIIRNRHQRWLHRQNLPFGTVGQVLTVYIIYATFCSTFARTDLDLDTFSLVALVFIILCLQMGIMALLLLTSSRGIFHFDSHDSVAITYGGTHKSLTLGIPLIEIIFEGNPDMSIMSIPLLIYSPMQILLGSLTVAPFKMWLDNQKWIGSSGKSLGLQV